jgi:hypothetical protein
MTRTSKPKVAFVLSGGASLGAIQVGMLRALYEREIAPDFNEQSRDVGQRRGRGVATTYRKRGAEQLARRIVQSLSGVGGAGGGGAGGERDRYSGVGAG